MAFARFFSLLQSKKSVEELTPEEFRDKYFQMTAEDIKMLTQDNVSCPLCIHKLLYARLDALVFC